MQASDYFMFSSEAVPKHWHIEIHVILLLLFLIYNIKYHMGFYTMCQFYHPWISFQKSNKDKDIRWIIEKAREFWKNISCCFIDYAKAFDCVDHNKLWKILREMGIPNYLTCLLRNLHAGQETS